MDINPELRHSGVALDRAASSNRKLRSRAEARAPPRLVLLLPRGGIQVSASEEEFSRSDSRTHLNGAAERLVTPPTYSCDI